jgi:hypothetical protein
VHQQAPAFRSSGKGAYSEVFETKTEPLGRNNSLVSTMHTSSDTTELPPVLQAFLRELPDAGYSEFAELLTTFLTNLSDMGLESSDADNLLTAITLAAAMPWSVQRRLDAVHELIGIDRPKGPTTVVFNRDRGDMHITRQSRLS